MKAYMCLAFLIQIINFAGGYEILVVFPAPAPSHYILGNALAKGLANAGHKVTIVSPYEEKDPPKNGSYTELVLTGIMNMMQELRAPTWMEFGSKHPVDIVYSMMFPGLAITNFTMKHPAFKNLLNSGKKFDVIIIEQFLNDALKVLGCHFNAPVIVMGTFAPSMWSNLAAGNSEMASYVTDILLDFPTKMNTWQRTMNTLLIIARRIITEFIYIPAHEELVKENFPHCANGNKFFYNVSLTLVNYHPSINTPIPLVPSMIPIGGFHIAPPKKLPNDIQTFLDDAKEGVIYFSLGSNVLPSAVGNATIEAIVNALVKRKEKVLWKWDASVFPMRPANFKVGKWFSQQDVLAHPNVKLFITHGGLLSLQEAVYHAVPVLVLPVFADQFRNGIIAEENEIGEHLSIRKTTEAELAEKINRVISDSKYRKNMKERSKLFTKRPIKPMDLAIYWVEQVAENKGAPYLRVEALNIELYKYLSLDVIALVILAIVIPILLAYYLIKSVLKSLLGSKKKVKIN